MMLPSIHLNGSSPQRMVEDLLSAVRALGQAREMVCDAAPNARDYYPQGDTAFGKAREEHEARIASIKRVEAELEVIVSHVQDQIDARERQRRR